MLRFLPLILLFCLILTLISGQVRAAELRRAVTVQGDTIRLGDLFDGLTAEQAERSVATAPAPGRKLTLDAPALNRIAGANGLDWKAMGGADRTLVERDTFTFSAEDVRKNLHQELIAQGAPASLDLTLDNRNYAVHLPAELEHSMVIVDLVYDAVRGRVNAEIVAPSLENPAVRQQVGARVIDVVELPVLNRRVGIGELIQDADIAWVKIARDRVDPGIATDARQLVGKTPRRAVAQGQPVRESELRSEIVVAKGQLVTILLQSASFTLTAQGKALEDGGLGETIRISNTGSGRTIDAVVAGPNLVRVTPPQATPLPAPLPQSLQQPNTGTPLAYPPSTKGRSAAIQAGPAPT
jgi:flagellar basal body P-ring formation protein FlgA